MVWLEARRYLSLTEFKRGIPIKAAYVVAQQADLLLTTFAVSNGFREINPIMRAALNEPVELLLLKLFIPVVIAWLVPAKLLLPAVALLLLVLVLNLSQLMSLL